MTTPGCTGLADDAEQQSAFAYPLAAPYRGAGHPDDIVWFEPVPGRMTTWRFGSDILEPVETARRSQAEMGMVPGEHIPTLPTGCGPDAPNEDGPPGVLEYETPSALFYRLDRRRPHRRGRPPRGPCERGRILAGVQASDG